MAQNFCDRDRTTWLDMHSNFKMAHFTDVENSKLSILVRRLRLLWSSNLQNGPKQKGKYLGHFEVWMHIKSCDPISATAVLGHFEVYNSLSTRSFRMRKFGHLWSLRTLSSETNSKFRSRDHDTIFVDGQVISNIFIFSPRHDVQFIFYDR